MLVRQLFLFPVEGNMCKLPKRMAGCVGGSNARNIALVDVNEFGVAWAAVTNAGGGGQWTAQQPSIAALPHTPPPGDPPSILAREQELLH